jgi:hypothetical protein
MNTISAQNVIYVYAYVKHIANNNVAVAPLLDGKVCSVECIVSGDRGVYTTPIEMRFVGLPEQQEQVSEHLRRFGYQLRTRDTAAVSKGKATERQHANQQWRQMMSQNETLDKDQAQQVLEKLTVSAIALANLPEASQPVLLRTKLLAYQRQALHWLISHEHPQLPTDDEPTQFW